MAFIAIAKRTVFLVNHETGEKVKFTIGIGAPYRPAKTPGMSDHAGCLVQVYEEIDDPGGEICGADEIEALDNAIQNVKVILTGLVAAGNVETADGKRVSMKSESKFTLALESAHEKVRQKFERKFKQKKF